MTLNELLQFAALCAEKRRDFKEHEFTMQLQVHPRFFDEQLDSAVGAIDYVRDSGNCLLTSIPL